jgi:arsenate reductase
MAQITVLFLCTGNSARSQIAEAFLRRFGGDRFDVYSAGLEPRAINPYTFKVMKELGYDLQGHRSKDVMEYMGKKHFSYLITVCAYAEKHCPRVFPGVSERMHWAIEDPATFVGSEEETMAKFREIRDEIATHVKAWIADLHIVD